MSIFTKIFQIASKPINGIEAEFALFKEAFFLKPDVRFYDYLREERVASLLAWFDPSSGYLEPTAFIRLVNDATRRGMNIWNQTGITMNLDGVPSPHSQDCLSRLAQILGFPITVYFKEAPEGELVKMAFPLESPEPFGAS